LDTKHPESLLLLVFAVDLCCWSFLLVLLLVIAVGVCCESLLLVVPVGRFLLVFAVGLCCWSLLWVVAVGICCWSFLLVGSCWSLLRLFVVGRCCGSFLSVFVNPLPIGTRGPSWPRIQIDRNPRTGLRSGSNLVVQPWIWTESGG